MTVKQEKLLVPPDGGWGWMVVLGASIVNLSTRSIEPSFGLLFGDLLRELDIATTGASVIMATMDAMINFSGLFVGPLIKKYSYRTVGVVGGVLSSLALTSTSAADSFSYILLTYSIMGGIGFGLATASTFVALNSYFVQRRGQAVGLAMAGTALGFMAMPQVVSFLLGCYDFRGALVILGALSLNAVVGATLLQPVAKHMKPAEPVEDVENPPPPVNPPPPPNPPQDLDLKLPEIREPEATDLLLGEMQSSTPSLPVRVANEASGPAGTTPDGMRRQLSVASALHSHHSHAAPYSSSSTSGMPRQSSFCRYPGLVSANKRLLLSFPRIASTSSISSRKRKTSIISNVSHLDFMGSTMHLELDDCTEEDDDCGVEIKPVTISGNFKSDNSLNESKQPLPPTISDMFVNFWRRLNKVMDLDLLKDVVYLNILFGLSITYVAELNFKTVVPFFMENLGYKRQQTAFALSTMAIADIFARVTIPPILDRLPYSRRSTLMAGCFFLSIVRSSLAEQTEWTPLLICFVINGFLRGVTLINVPLVLSEYASDDKYPAALGLSMVAKGIFIVFLGPMIGLVRDMSGSYPLCIHAQTVMIALCLVAWGIEYIIAWRHQRHKEDLPVASAPVIA